MKKDRRLYELYQKMLAGATSAEERETIIRWLNQLDTGAGVDQQELDRRKTRSMTALRETIAPPAPLQRKPLNRIWSAGAAAAVVLAFAVAAWLTGSVDDRDGHGTADDPTAAAVVEHRTTAGQRKLLTLSDGSRVWLGNASTIHYTQNFQEGKRELFLRGQAFFEVTPDSTRPFLVHTGGLEIKVLGTSFDVEHYDTDARQTVTVASGKVSVQPEHDRRQSWVLETGQQVVFHSADRTGFVRTADLSTALSWKNGELIFREETLEQIAARLERWYGVNIHVGSQSLQAKQMTLSVKDEPLQMVLNMLSKAGGFHFEITGTHVEIRK